MKSREHGREGDLVLLAPSVLCGLSTRWRVGGRWRRQQTEGMMTPGRSSAQGQRVRGQSRQLTSRLTRTGANKHSPTITRDDGSSDRTPRLPGARLLDSRHHLATSL